MAVLAATLRAYFKLRSGGAGLACALAGLWLASSAGAAAQESGADALALNPEAAIARSQAAIGRSLGDHAFVDQAGRPVRLADYRGRPLVVGLLFTACTRSCPLILQRLAVAVEAAQAALGPDSFTVLSVGFDTTADTPARLRAYAREQGVSLPNWHFLSGDPASIDGLIEDLGFLRIASPAGFDHIAQISIVDPEGRVHAQVYGSNFETPALVEPLKDLRLAEAGRASDIAGLIERVRLFCTFYDSARGRYAFDYSFFISLAVAGFALAGVAAILLRSFLAARRPPGTTA